jgi:glycosyltransferase involved in cell wall biosynthesis
METGELIRCLDSADALIHFSSEESFGLVVAEALTRNLKFFGARTGGVLDIVTGVEGVEMFDAKDWTGLGRVLEQWITAGCPRPVGAAAAMQSRYHPQVVARRHLEIYEEVLRTVA